MTDFDGITQNNSEIFHLDFMQTIYLSDTLKCLTGSNPFPGKLHLYFEGIRLTVNS